MEEVIMKTRDIGITTELETQDTQEERYKKCGLLKIIQHIDIYGKHRRSYAVSNVTRRRENISCTSISSCSRNFSDCSTNSSLESPSLDSKLSKLSVTTKISGLWPGHDILSRKARRYRSGGRTWSGPMFVPRF